MARRGLRVEADRIVAAVKKQTGKTDGLDLTIDEIDEAESTTRAPLEPIVANLFRRYKTITDAVHELAAWSPPKDVPEESPLPAPSPGSVCSDFLAPYRTSRGEVTRERLQRLKDALSGKPHDLRKVVTFLRGIHCELENVSPRSIPWSFIPEAAQVKIILMGHSDDFQSWATSPPPDLEAKLQRMGEIEALIVVWRRVGELVLIYGKPTTFFRKYAPDLTPTLFDPDRLNDPICSAKTLGRCLFVWGLSARLNPTFRKEFDRIEGRGAAFQEVLTGMTGRQSYKEGRPSGSGTTETPENIRLRGRIVDAIQHLQKDPSEHDPNLAREYEALLTDNGYWPDVAPLVGKRSTSYTDACRIVSKHVGTSLQAVKKSCLRPAKG